MVMVELIKKISAVLLAIVVLVSTSGFTVYEHNCNCCQTTDYSLTIFSSCCDHDSAITNETAPETCSDGICCNITTDEKTQNHVCSADGCCNFNNNYEKLAVDFDKSQTVSIRFFPKLINVIQILNPIVLVEPELQKLIHISQNAPPILSETDFVIFAHALKIPF
jgi:hypothetical protein